MKKLVLFPLLVLFFACSKEDEPKTPDSTIKFYQTVDYSCGYVTISRDGNRIGVITSLEESNQSCDSYLVGEDIQAGTYTYKFEDNCDTWFEEITINENECLKFNID